MKLLKHTKPLKASTLPEVLVGLSLLSLLFGMGMKLISQMGGIHAPSNQYQTHLLMETFLNEPLGDDFEWESEREIKGRRLLKSLRPLAEYPHLWELKVSCYWGDERLGSRSLIVYLDST